MARLSGLVLFASFQLTDPKRSEDRCTSCRCDFFSSWSRENDRSVGLLLLPGQSDDRLLVVAPKNAFAAWDEQSRIVCQG